MSAIEVIDRTQFTADGQELVDAALKATLKAAARGLAKRATAAVSESHPPMALAALILATVDYAEDCGVSADELAEMIREGRT